MEEIKPPTLEAVTPKEEKVPLAVPAEELGGIKMEEVKAPEIARPGIMKVEVEESPEEVMRKRIAEMEVQEAMVICDGEVLAQIVQAFGQRFSSGKVKLIGTREGEKYKIIVLGVDVC